MCVRFCDRTYSGDSASEAISLILPIAIKGMTSNVTDVKKWTSAILLKICQSSSELISPYLDAILPNCLESLSSNEDQSLNYLEFHVGENREMLDRIRLDAAKFSASNEIIAACVKIVDNSHLPLAAKLVNRTVHTAQRTAHSAHRTAHSAQRTAHSAQRTAEKFVLIFDF